MSEFMSRLQQSAIALHELFTSYVNAGFTREEALRLILVLMAQRVKDAS